MKFAAIWVQAQLSEPNSLEMVLKRKKGLKMQNKIAK